MRLPELTLLYALVGVGCTIALLMRQRSSRPAVDITLMTTLWPLYAPFVLARGEQTVNVKFGEKSFLEALQQVSGTPLAFLLPDPTEARALARRLSIANDKVVELDRMLTQPEFDELTAVARQEELEAQGDRFASETAKRRVQNIRRLRGLRNQFARQLDQVGELLSQLRIQAEVVRFAGQVDDGTRDLVSELICRLEGLDEVLDQTSLDE